MRYQVTDCVYGGKRLWIENCDSNAIDPVVRNYLDILSKWGGADKYTDKYTSWEIHDDVVHATKRILDKYGFSEDTSTIPVWMN